MNNQQFRSLLLSNSQKNDGGATTAASPPTTRPSATPALGARKRSAFPMTPRQVGHHSGSAEFARQLAERNGKPGSGVQQKKFKSSLPKGVKLAAGYRDRAKDRDEADDQESEVAQRVKALEEAMKEGQIDRETFDNLVQEIAGGDLSATHLVKGLDRKLLEKVRKGEVGVEDALKEQNASPGLDVEDEFEELAQQEIAPVVKEKIEKKGEKAPPPPVAGVKRTRDAILAELKAQRKAAEEAAAAEHQRKYPTLGPGFRKIGPGGESTRIEIDSGGREVLIITDANGKEKRKVRKQKVQQPEVERRFDIEKKPLPITKDTLPPPKEPDSKKKDEDEDEEEDEDEDIFAGVGSNYNPLAAIQGDEDGDESSEEEEEGQAATVAQKGLNGATGKGEDAAPPGESTSEPNPSTEPSASRPRRSYFNDIPTSAKGREKDAADVTVLAALKKVRTLDVNSSLLQDSEEARLAKRAAELAARDRDMEDLDMGFGASRFDDAEEMEMDGDKVKFSEWKGLGADDDDEGHKGGPSKKRKRGPKKKKGDKNSVADVLKVMERQKGAKTLG